MQLLLELVAILGLIGEAELVLDIIELLVELFVVCEFLVVPNLVHRVGVLLLAVDHLGLVLVADLIGKSILIGGFLAVLYLIDRFIIVLDLIGR